MTVPPAGPPVPDIGARDTAELAAAVAAALAVLAAAATPRTVTAPLAGRRGRWNDPIALIRQPGRPGPGAWRASSR